MLEGSESPKSPHKLVLPENVSIIAFYTINMGEMDPKVAKLANLPQVWTYRPLTIPIIHQRFMLEGSESPKSPHKQDTVWLVPRKESKFREVKVGRGTFGSCHQIQNGIVYSCNLVYLMMFCTIFTSIFANPGPPVGVFVGLPNAANSEKWPFLAFFSTFWWKLSNFL